MRRESRVWPARAEQGLGETPGQQRFADMLRAGEQVGMTHALGCQCAAQGVDGGAGLLAESSLGRLALVIAILAALAGAGVVRGVMNALVRAMLSFAAQQKIPRGNVVADIDAVSLM